MEQWRMALDKIVSLATGTAPYAVADVYPQAEIIREAFRALRRRARAREQVLRQMLHNVYEIEFSMSRTKVEDDIESKLKGVK